MLPLPQPIIKLEHEDEVTSVSFTSDDMLLASTSGYTVTLWDTIKGKEARLLSHGATGDYWSIAVVCSPVQPMAAAGSVDHLVTFWDVNTGVEARSLSLHEDAVLAMAFSADGAYLASASVDGSVIILPLADDSHPARLLPFATGVQSLAFHPHAALLAMGSVERHDGATLSVWDMDMHDVVCAIDVGESVPALTFQEGADLLAYVTGEGHGALLRYRSHAPQEKIGSPAERYTCLTFLHGGAVLALGTLEGAVEFWDVNKHALIERHQPHKAAVYMIVCSRNGRRLASASQDNTAIIWEP